ncbi:MAG: HypC/HybG/HupF family hydrogenase formation chaperone [Patescibacteria group bacterium]
MCLAIPLKVIKTENDWAVIQSGDHQHRVNLNLLKNVKIGDYLLVHNDLAINKIKKSEAEKILKMISGPNK